MVVSNCAVLRYYSTAMWLANNRKHPHVMRGNHKQKVILKEQEKQ